jgi:hypothetical protein
MIKKYLITAAIILPLIGQLSYAQSPLDRIKEVKKENKAETYELAALNRRKAADLQAEHASKLTTQAGEIKQIYEKNEIEKNRRFCAAGELEIQAGDMQVAASKNYQISMSNMISCANSYEKPSKDKIEKFQKQTSLDAYNSREYLEKSIMTYLSAADDFSWANGANPAREAFANEKAASVLEKIAKEKP